MMFSATGDDKKSGLPMSSLQWTQPCRHFRFPEILLATENFDETLIIGHGGFGNVYIGTIYENGSTSVNVAIKRLDSMSHQGAAEFWAEVEMLSKLRHCNLVSLIGYCNYGNEMILVYEYMPNGTLEDHLHKLHTPLTWLQRLKICIGAARGLDYLHTGTGIEFGVIHRDVKSSNVLLHESWAAKISDFGLSRIGPTNQPNTYVNTLIKGTFGYLDPDYFTTGRLTRKSDVYAFGVVMLEVLCRKRAVDKSLDEEQWNLAAWAQDSVKEGKVKNIIDSELRGQVSQKSLKEFVKIADKCLHSRPKQRPTMSDVVANLESILAIEEKINSSSQTASRTIFGRLIDMIPLASGKEHYGNIKGKSIIANNKPDIEKRDDPADYSIPNPSLTLFKFEDMRDATQNFSPNLLLGEGGLGMVFLGWVDKNTFTPSSPGVGMAIAVRKCSRERSQGHDEWQAELGFLGWLVHPNIVTLLGYCCNELDNLLVYEYIQNGSFDLFLHRNASVVSEPISWETRLNVMIGVARALSYLHSSKPQIIHRHVDCSSIFLDQDFNAKLGHFELARSCPGIDNTHVTTHVFGTIGHTDPEYMRTGHLSVKSDIYSFGVVLLQTLTGMWTFDGRKPVEHLSFINMGGPTLAKRELKKIMDPNFEHNYPIEGAFECASLAARCVAEKPKDRPSSEEVLRSLEQIYMADK